jgi:cardiolipin synthase
VKLIIQPDDGVSPLITAIKSAKERIDLTIFRFDHADLDEALRAAVSRGVKVNALVASVNHGGEKGLRKLEMHFLDAGITVARSASELIRYHDKVMVVDQRTLYVLSFNFTHIDIDHSRGFGIVTNNAKWVAEGVKLLDADSKRTAYTGGMDTFVVSPTNARKALGNFLKRARKHLLIYDPKISDKEMISILRDRARDGVEIRIIGEVDTQLPVKKLGNFRLHTRTIIRDGSQAFIGSQSLRTAELDSRREVGLIVRNAKIVKKLVDTFESDWEVSGGEKEKSANERGEARSKEEKEKAVKVLIHELDPIADTVKKTVKRIVAKAGDDVLEDGTLQETVKGVVKKVMKQAVKEAVKK